MLPAAIKMCEVRHDENTAKHLKELLFLMKRNSNVVM
jgi:hypothetical protein